MNDDDDDEKSNSKKEEIDKKRDAIAVTTGRRMGKCQTCDNEVGKYRCPACNFISCSLECVKKHKSTQNCDGKRKRFAFVNIREMNDMHCKAPPFIASQHREN